MAQIKKNNKSQSSKSINRTTPPPDISNFTTEDIQALFEEQHIQQVKLRAQVEELKQIHEELSESRDKYQQLYDTVPVGYLTIDNKYNILEANATAARMLGTTQLVLLKTKFTDLISPNTESQDLFYLHVRQLFKIGSQINCELEMQRSDGSRFTANLLTITEGDAGESSQIHIMIQDVTERKKNEEALKISEDRFRTLIEESPIAICVSRKGRELFTNKSFKNMFGIPLNEDTTGHPVTNHYAEECKEDTLKRIRRRADNLPVPNEFEAIGLKRDGSRFDTHLAVTEVTLLDGRAVVSFIMDITERKQAREALGKIRDDLEVKVKERTEQLQVAYDEIIQSQKSLKEANKQLKFFGHKITQIQEEERKRIAYELHDDTAQYLGILKMQIGSLAESEEIESPKVKEKLRFLEKDADRAFQDVRRYSHELRPTTLEHQGLVAALEQIAEDFNKLGQFSIEEHVEGMEPELSEEVKLGFFRIAQEALNNTRKHAKASQANIDLKFTPKRMKMIVSDNGEGFDHKKALKKSSDKGSLGLMSMRERADLIGATLKIESNPGEGTIIEVAITL
jgi:PAS domain S-box-containing protein